MIQDIEPRIFDNEFKNREAEPQDLFLSYEGDKVLVREDIDTLWYPSFSDFEAEYPTLLDEAQFLFSIDEINYFLVEKKGLDTVTGWTYVNTDIFRTEPEHWRSFAGVIGWQLYRWYKNHLFCSRCAKPVKRSKKKDAILRKLRISDLPFDIPLCYCCCSRWQSSSFNQVCRTCIY